VAAREVLVGQNWRNLKVVLLIATLAAGNIAFHLEAHFSGFAEYSSRLGMATAVMLVSLIGGRIVPSFTHNWLTRENPGRVPVPFGRFDVIALLVSAPSLLAWVIVPTGPTTGALLLLAGMLHTLRLARWAGDRTWRDRLVLILHIGYAFIPVGFLLTGASGFDLVPSAAGIHALAAGAFGVMTLAVMTRASLGHTGRRLEASVLTQAIYTAVVLAALSRICAALHSAWSLSLRHVAAVAWAVAFLGFAAGFGPMLIRARRHDDAA
jgi:uncharacterized protein involved in response to NO